jgi:hypothetical protein
VHNEELLNLYSSPSTIIMMKTGMIRWARHAARKGVEKKACSILVGKPEGKRPQGRPRRRLVNNIRMVLGEVGFGAVDWIGLAQDTDKWRALVNCVMNLRVP